MLHGSCSVGNLCEFAYVFSITILPFTASHVVAVYYLLCCYYVLSSLLLLRTTSLTSVEMVLGSLVKPVIVDQWRLVTMATSDHMVIL